MKYAEVIGFFILFVVTVLAVSFRYEIQIAALKREKDDK